MLANQRANKLFHAMRQEILSGLFCTYKNEGINSRDICGQHKQFMLHAIFTYLMLIYRNVTDPYNKVLYNLEGAPNKPLSLYLERYEYEDMKKCLSCLGTDLNKYFDVLKLEDIIMNDNTDSESLLTDTVVDSTYYCDCTKTAPLVEVNLI